MLDSFEKKSMKQILGNYCKDPYTLDFLSKLLIFNPDKQMTLEQALSHPYVAEFHRANN